MSDRKYGGAADHRDPLLGNEPTVVCAVCEKPVVRIAFADWAVHRACGRQLETVWSYCRHCDAYRSLGQYVTATLRGRSQTLSVCECCGNVSRRYRA